MAYARGVRTRGEVSVPPTVRAAGALVGLQGLASFTVAVVLLVRAFSGGTYARIGFGEAIIFTVVAIAFAVPGILLLLGRRGARNAVVFLQILLLGGIWYQFSAVDSLLVDIGVTAWCLAVLLLLFVGPSRYWGADR